MAGVIEASGDVAAAASAFGAIVLVFFGFSISSFDGFEEDQKDAVRGLYRRRIWPAFVALVASILSCGLSLYGKIDDCECAAILGVAMLAVVGVAIMISAIQFLREIG
jgi:hypothetical protein